MNRITCSVQTGISVTVYAIDESKPVISGPITIEAGSFFVDQSFVALNGIFDGPDSAHGTIYLHYTDPVSNASCVLGNFDWTVAPIHS